MDSFQRHKQYTNFTTRQRRQVRLADRRKAERRTQEQREERVEDKRASLQRWSERHQKQLSRCGDVEENPGMGSPGASTSTTLSQDSETFDGFGMCKYAGRRILGQKVRVRGKSVYNCPDCASRLYDLRGSCGMHPGPAPLCEVMSDPLPPAPLPDKGKGPSIKIVRPNTPVPPPAPSLDPPPAPKEKEIKANEHVLLGHEISDADKEAIMTRMMGVPVTIQDIHEQEMDVKYQGERRLASNRNVQEIKQAFRACQLTCVNMSHSWWCLLLVGFTVAMCVAQMTTCIIFRLYYYVFFGLAVLTALYFVVSLPRAQRCSVPYIPHLVSAVMAEFDRGTNVVAARSTIRQKIRRLASLPIPDEDALKFINGTELVCEQLLSHEDFFWEGAACFRQPQ